MTQLKKSNPKPLLEPFEAIGTWWRIDTYEVADDFDKVATGRTVRERIAVFDYDYSRFRDDSLVALMAREAGIYSLPADAKPMFDLYQELYELTDGAMTPLIGRVLDDAGYNANYSFQERRMVAPPVWEEAMHYDFPQLTLHQPVLLDVGAIGKGYLIDLIGKVLETYGARGFCIDAGGDIFYCRPDGTRTLRVGLEHPAQEGQAIGVAELSPGLSLCGSAGNRRRWGRFHHIIDPFTLSSPEHIRAVWAVADNARLADALTTALYLVEPARLIPKYTFEYAIVYDDYSLKTSRNFPAKFFVRERAL